MNESYSTPSAASEPVFTWSHVFSLPADRLLVLLGGLSAVGFGVLTFVLAAVNGRALDPQAPFGTGGVILALALSLFLGAALVHAMVRMSYKTAEGGALALAFSLVLLMFGGVAGMIGGILGIVGAGLALARSIKWS